MAPTLRGIGTNGSTGGSDLTVVTDVAAEDGDLILIVTDVNITPPFPDPSCTGFTPLHDSPNSTYNRLTLLGRIANGDGDTYVITDWGAVDGSKTATVLIYQDADSTLPTNIVSALDSGSNTTYSIPALTTAANASIDLAIVGFGGNNDVGAAPNFASWGGSLSELVDYATNAFGAYYSGLGIASAVRATAGSQAATSVTADTADVNTSIRLEIKAATGGGGTTYNQSAGGTLTGSGSLSKQTRKGLAGTLTGSGSLLKRASKLLAGTLTGSGALIKRTTKLVAGTLTGSGVLVKQARKVLAGTLTSSGTVIKQSRKVLAGTLTGAGSLIKRTSKLLAGTLTGSGAMVAVRTFLKSVGGTLTGSGSLVKQTQKPLAGTLASAGTLLKQVRKAFGGTLTGSGTLTTVKVFLKAVGGTLTGSGTLSKQTQKPLAGTLSSAGSLVKRTSKVLAGTLTGSGSLSKRIAKAIGGTLTGSGLLSALASGAASIIGRIRALFTTSAPGASFGSSTPGADLDSTTPGADIDTET